METAGIRIKPVQCVHNLLGRKEDVDALAALSYARILVVSDTHGARDILMAVIREKGAEAAAMVFCGDGVSDVLYCITCALNGSPNVPPVVAFVGGNNDYDVCTGKFDPRTGEMSGSYHKVIVPNRQVLNVAGHTIFIAHGNRQGVRIHDASPLSSEADMAGADMVLFGHTHVATLDENAINPGSLKYPRDGGDPSFAVVELRPQHSPDVTFYCITATMQGLECRPFLPKREASWR